MRVFNFKQPTVAKGNFGEVEFYAFLKYLFFDEDTINLPNMDPEILIRLERIRQTQDLIAIRQLTNIIKTRMRGE